MTPSDGAYRRAAASLYPDVRIEAFGPVVRLADGGAFVEAQVFVPERLAQRADEDARGPQITQVNRGTDAHG